MHKMNIMTDDLKLKIIKDPSLSFAQIGLIIFLIEKDDWVLDHKIWHKSDMTNSTVGRRLIDSLNKLGLTCRGKNLMLKINKEAICERYSDVISRK